MALVAKKADNTDGFELIYKSINDIQANEFNVATSIDGRQSQEFLEQTKKHLDKKAVKNQVDKLAKTTTDKVDDALKKTNKISKKFVENPFDEAGNLKPNVKFKTGEFEYFGETDEFGRLERFDTDNLQLTQRTERLPHNPNTPDKLEGDHSGHIFGDRFGGSPELDNLVSQSSKVNLSTFKKLENKWAKALNQNKKVEVEIKIKYSDDSKKSSSFEINYKIESEKYSEIIENN